MTKRVIKRQVIETNEQYGMRPLPTDKAWVAYARQSTTHQVKENTESTELQTKGLQKRALSLGYLEELGTLCQEGNGVRGVSGSVRIDLRSDLKDVVGRIKADEVKTVFILSESRLFRDPTGVQYNVFADVCKEHDCYVVTPRTIYDYSRSEHRKAWRQRCESEADYLEYHVPMMHEARKQAALRGEYVSGRVAVGYVVDTDHKLTVFEPHAQVVRGLFTRFRELEGKINTLAKEVKSMGAVFPAADMRLNLKRVGAGWGITRDGLQYLLCNPIYIGHHSVNGVVVMRNHHTAIVDESDFLWAFNRLSEYDLDGNPQERIRTRPTRYQRVTTQPVSALLTERITSKACPVHVNRAKGQYVASAQENGMVAYSAAIKIAILDAVFSQHFTYVVKQDVKRGDGQAFDVLKQATTDTSVMMQVAEIEKQTTLLRAKMDATDDLELLRKWNTKLRELTQLKPQLERILAKQGEAVKTVEEYETLLDQIRGRWRGMSPDAKQKAVNALIERAVLTKETPHWYQLEVYWKLPVGRVDVGFIWYQNGGGFLWTPQEDETIKALYPNAGRETVQQALPRRAWYAIGDRAYQKGIRRTVAATSDVPDYLSWEDYSFQKEHELTSEAGTEYRATWRTKTTDSSAAFRQTSDRCLLL
jgi:DNA invertase Pin-like site-specific DNA recombinase